MKNLRLVTWASALFFSIVPVIAISQSAPSQFEDCSNLSSDEIQTHISDIVSKNMTGYLRGTNFYPLVYDSWAAVDGDRKFSAIVDTYIDRKLDDRQSLMDFFNVFRANYQPGWAEELAREVIEEIFTSPEFSDLSDEIGKEISGRIEQSSNALQATEQTQLDIAECMAAHLGSKYNETIASFAQLEVPSISPEIPAGAEASVIFNFATIISGILLLIGRRIIARILARLLGRIATALGARVLATFTGVGGVILIIVDLVAGGDGPYPLIREELKNTATRDQIIRSIADAIPEQALEDLPKEVRDAAARLEAELNRFRESNRVLLDLTESVAPFNVFVGNLDPAEELNDLISIIRPLQADGGSQAVKDAFDRGELQRYMLMSDAGKRLAQTLRSIPKAEAWIEAVPGHVNRLMEAELFRYLEPDTLRVTQLERLLEMDNAETIQELSQMPEEALDELLDLPTATLNNLGDTLSTRELRDLADVLGNLEGAAERIAFVRTLINDGGARASEILGNGGLIQGIIASSDQVGAIELVERPGLRSLMKGISMTLQGEIDWRVVSQSNALVRTILLLIVALGILAGLKWFWPRKARASKDA